MQITAPAKNNALTLDIKSLIDESRRQVAVTVNSTITMLYWQVGRRINNDVLQNRRAEYGRQVVKELSETLTKEYGKGWSDKHLQHCMYFAETFDEQIVSAVRRQLTWTHIKSLMYIENPLKREFYIEMCKIERWSTRQLDGKIDAMLYERSAIAAKPEEVIKAELAQMKNSGTPTPDAIFRSSYVLDFLGLSSAYSEKDLENAIVAELENFILELGQGFAFLERQKRFLIDGEDYHLDLLFYHRKLNRLVAIDLKLGKFKPKHKAQMELYLKYLQRNDRQPHENEPIGLLLCSEGNTEHIEYLMLGEDNIKVAQYLSELPDKQWFIDKMHKAIEIYRQNEKL